MLDPSGTCTNCRAADATCWWSGEHGMLGFIRGWREAWCKRCVLIAQIAHAEKLAADLPELRAKLAALDAAEPVAAPD